jgi:phosphatidylserine/phosphatidylglycerophosphate/cardiolipin synthase-like enzyme
VTRDDEQQRRIYRALIENIEQWQEQLAIIESYAIPGNKARILHLMANIEQARRALERMVASVEEP